MKTPFDKSALAAQLKAQTKLRRAAVDEYGDLALELAPLKPKTARLAALASTIRAWHPDSAEAISEYGDHYLCTLSASGNQTRIEDMQAVYDSLGHDKFLAACSMTLAALKTAGGNTAALTVIEQTGPRAIAIAELDD